MSLTSSADPAAPRHGASRWTLRPVNRGPCSNALSAGCPVSLDTVVMDEATLSSRHQHPPRLTGRVLVRNWSFEKQVTVRCTFDSWRTHVDVKASFEVTVAPSCDGVAGVDRFVFHVDTPGSAKGDEGAAVRCELAMAVKCVMAGAEHWDNNGGADHVFSLAASARVPAPRRRKVVGPSGPSIGGESWVEALRRPDSPPKSAPPRLEQVRDRAVWRDRPASSSSGAAGPAVTLSGPLPLSTLNQPESVTGPIMWGGGCGAEDYFSLGGGPDPYWRPSGGMMAGPTPCPVSVMSVMSAGYNAPTPSVLARTGDAGGLSATRVEKDVGGGLGTRGRGLVRITRRAGGGLTSPIGDDGGFSGDEVVADGGAGQEADVGLGLMAKDFS
ncbi:protein phosphatase 1, regulatory subunit, partial [Irineochytrium annulatum]